MSPKQSNQHPSLDDAILLAAQTHLRDRDKYGQPYILHPLRVMFRLETEIERIVGVLHDVVEDSLGKPHEVTCAMLRQMGYSDEIVQAWIA